jgi:hypothetical protein
MVPDLVHLMGDLREFKTTGRVFPADPVSLMNFAQSETMDNVTRLVCPGPWQRGPDIEHAFPQTTDEALGPVARLLRQIVGSENAGAQLHILAARLLDVFAQVEPTPRAEAALDNLYMAARRFAADQQSPSTLDGQPLNDLKFAYLQFRSEIVAAHRIGTGTRCGSQGGVIWSCCGTRSGVRTL